MHTDTLSSPAASAPKARTLRFRSLPFAILLTLIPAASQTQANRSCPRFARVPGYGACNNIGGSSCGFCTYRCNDETVVRWNVCAL